jgi:hypothetical protein
MAGLHMVRPAEHVHFVSTVPVPKPVTSAPPHKSMLPLKAKNCVRAHYKQTEIEICIFLWHRSTISGG